jgi:hypothetical protein
MNPNEERFDAFEGHLQIPVDDVEDDDLLQYFPSAISFIKEGLQAGGGVLVHWLAIFFFLFCIILIPIWNMARSRSMFCYPDRFSSFTMIPKIPLWGKPVMVAYCMTNSTARWENPAQRQSASRT